MWIISVWKKLGKAPKVTPVKSSTAQQGRVPGGASKERKILVKKTESQQPQGARKGSTASGAKKALKPHEAIVGKRPKKASKATNVVQPKLTRTGGVSGTQQRKKQEKTKGSLPKLSKVKTASPLGAMSKGKRTVQSSADTHTKGITTPPRSQPHGKPASPQKVAPSQTKSKSKSRPVLKLQPRQVLTPRRDLKSLKTDKASVIKQTLEAKRKAAGLLAGVGKKPALGKATVSGGKAKSKEAPKGTIKKAATVAEKKKVSTSSQKSASKAKQKTSIDEAKGTWWLPSAVQRFVTTLLSWSRGKLSRQTVKSVSDSHDDC